MLHQVIPIANQLTMRLWSNSVVNTILIDLIDTCFSLSLIFSRKILSIKNRYYIDNNNADASVSKVENFVNIVTI